MGALTRSRWEAFAQALAREPTVAAAGRTAGYKSDYIYTLVEYDEIKKRVAEVVETIEWGATSDLAPVIDALMRAAVNSAKLDNAVGLKATVDLLSKAAELKRLLPAAPVSAAPAPVARPAPMTLNPEEWSRRYPPRA